MCKTEFFLLSVDGGRLRHSLALYAWTAQNQHSCSERMTPDRERQSLSTWRVILGSEKLCTVQMGPDVISLIFFFYFWFLFFLLESEPIWVIRFEALK